MTSTKTTRFWAPKLMVTSALAAVLLCATPARAQSGVLAPGGGISSGVQYGGALAPGGDTGAQDAQDALSQYQNLPDGEKKKLEEQARQKYESLSPAEKEKIKEQIRRKMQNMSPEEKARIKAKVKERLQNMSPEEKAQLKEKIQQRIQNMSPGEKQKLQNALQKYQGGGQGNGSGLRDRFRQFRANHGGGQ